MKKKIALTLLASIAISSSSYAVNIRGASSCGKWVKDRNERVFSPSQAWLVGFLSGLAIGTDRDVVRVELDNDSIYLWMDNYCKANPLKDISDGGMNLAVEVMRKK